MSKFKLIEIEQGEDYYFDMNIVIDNCYLSLYTITFDSKITDGSISNGDYSTIETFNFELIDEFTVRCSLTNTQTSNLMAGQYKYAIKYTDADALVKYAVRGEICVESNYA